MRLLRCVVREVNVAASGNPKLTAFRQVTLSLMGDNDPSIEVSVAFLAMSQVELDALPEVGDRLALTLRVEGGE